VAEERKVELTFWDHLIELMKRLRMIFYSLIIATIFAMMFPVTLDFSGLSPSNPFYPTITTLVVKDLQQRFLPPEAQLLPLSPFAPLEVYMLISLVLGFVISSPVISFELYKFLNPALYKHERKSVLQFVMSFACLFIFGFFLGYFFVVPITMRTLFMFSRLLDLPPIYDFTEFFSLVGLSLFLCGMVFTFPTYVVMLVKVGILQTKQLTKYRKFLYGGILILIAIVDPEPSLVTESLLFLPIVVLMEISILISKRIEKTREKVESI